MKESQQVVLYALVFFSLGVIAIYFALFNTEFNFYESHLSFNNNEVTETLFFKPNKDYHALFRNFETPALVSPLLTLKDNIMIKQVTCNDGKSYVRDFSSRCYEPPTPITCPSYTEPNEYGCAFGDKTGFKKGEEYQIIGTYTLRPASLFKINGEYYIKFVAYSKERHKLLIKDKTFIIDNKAITKKFYFPNEDIIVYVPYALQNPYQYAIIHQEKFQYDRNIGQSILPFLVSFAPFLIFLSVWFFFGREHRHTDLPEELSAYPRERKGWEVASYFHPPFATIDQEFFSTMLLDLHRRRIINLKLKDRNMLVKILPRDSSNFDNIEFEFLKFLQELKQRAPEKDIEQGYVNLNKALRRLRLSSFIQLKMKDLEKKIKKESKQYLDKKGTYGGNAVFLIIILASLIQNTAGMIIPLVVSFFLFQWIARKTAILSHFKESYYEEYQRWQAFRNYLKGSPSMRESKHEAVILWEQYLVYASALGIAKEVLRQLRQQHIITEQQYQLYFITATHTSTSFMAASGTGGGGGVGGGGVGGGGGGGR